ncbi:hypothetical protein ScPMuIL_012114 [Solemya velum]
MFIKIVYGDKQNMLMNPNCNNRIFMDYLKDKCKYSSKEKLDLCDETGVVMNMESREPRDTLVKLFRHRMTYIPLIVEVKDTENPGKIIYTPLLQDWEKRYPELLRKIKSQGRKQSGSPEKLSRKSNDKNKKELISQNSLDKPKKDGTRSSSEFSAKRSGGMKKKKSGH